jgi:hypothetical protein
LKIEVLHAGMQVFLTGRMQTRDNTTVVYKQNVYSDSHTIPKDPMVERLLIVATVFPDYLQVPF